MLPDQQFDGYPSANPSPPWTPQVWRDGPDVLVEQARQALFSDSDEITNSILNGTDRAMAGGATGPENESDQLIDGSTPGDAPSHGDSSSGRASQWNTMMQDLRRNEPLAAWSDGSHDGPANPGP